LDDDYRDGVLARAEGGDADGDGAGAVVHLGVFLRDPARDREAVG
jgi:hypothetical protein